ncbi:hypothetical protein FB440_105126 [Vibrio crassostreae]|jgi:hypothetical protein|uniref:YnhF family membrane protein n=2 Tax=Vibrio TaxID=662 RepID=A0A1C3JGE8_9VIBR|nr:MULTISPECIES: YnhF family membrane protein [Vibrio]MDD1826164.1 YnhF family membrane protein [Photobacterium sp. ZSDE20]MBE8575158.1 YnhF family membrane protein [Vibrio sp. OPT18]MCC4888305.1 YnhF family membrane protein [Vibrio sp. F13]MCG9544286.1 YnhF family membrane protein [Vibrio sp. Isolate33]MCK8075985.1 YnhF family membrane protein [Vibrio sp. 1CM2L]
MDHNLKNALQITVFIYMIILSFGFIAIGS